MHFKQYYLGCLAHASYLIADKESRTAAVVVTSPVRSIEIQKDSGLPGPF